MKQVDKNRNLGLKNLRHNRFEKVINGAAGGSSKNVRLQGIDGGDKNNWGIAKPFSLSNERGSLKAVHHRQADVHKNQRKVLLEQQAERLGARTGRRDVAPRPGEKRLHGRERLYIIVNYEDVRRCCVHNRLRNLSVCRKARCVVVRAAPPY